MSNFKKLKYFKEIVLKELNDYITINSRENKELKEIYLRNIVSRLYYTAMHFCIEKFNIEIDENDKTHEQVINNISEKSIKIKLKTLKKLREKADYKYQNFSFPLSTGGTKGVFLNSTEHIIQTLDFFENISS